MNLPKFLGVSVLLVGIVITFPSMLAPCAFWHGCIYGWWQCQRSKAVSRRPSP
jgi:hypothetical protein